MEISYLKHCVGTGSVGKILQDGYLEVPEHLKDIDSEEKVFLQIVFKGVPSMNYASVCVKLDKRILNTRRRYYVNDGWNYGKKDEYTIEKPKNFSYSAFDEVNPLTNEVVFNGKLIIRDFIQGVVFAVAVDSNESLRPDIIYNLYKYDDLVLRSERPNLDEIFEEYSRYIDFRYGFWTKDKLKSKFDEFIEDFDEISKHTIIEFEIYNSHLPTERYEYESSEDGNHKSPKKEKCIVC